MINRIIGFSVRNKFLIFALVAAACIWGTWSMLNLPLDATPDLSETQVIILSRWDRSPDIIEDQVTYPIITAMTGAPKVRTVRGISDFGFSYVYVVFEEGTDIYWARSRTLEYLSGVTSRLPQGVKTEIGPDATGLGWVFQYVLKDASGKKLGQSFLDAAQKEPRRGALPIPRPRHAADQAESCVRGKGGRRCLRRRDL